MPVVVFSYRKALQDDNLASTAGPIELSVELDSPPGLRHWRLVNFTWVTVTKIGGVNPVDQQDHIASSCLCYPDFLRHSQSRSSIARNLTPPNAPPLAQAVLTHDRASSLFFRKNAFVFNVAPLTGPAMTGTFDQSNFNPVNFGFLNITTNVLTMRFEGESFDDDGAGLATANIVKFDAIYEYE